MPRHSSPVIIIFAVGEFNFNASRRGFNSFTPSVRVSANDFTAPSSFNTRAKAENCFLSCPFPRDLMSLL